MSVVALTAAAAVGCGSSPSAPSPTPTPEPTQLQACLVGATFGPPEQSPYVLPYPVGTSYSVYQSYCGPQSHMGQLAYDFLLPDGSTVTAARAGEVVAVIDKYGEPDGSGHDFNYVHIRHDDGSIAFYAHFQLGGILVHQGDRVTIGQPLGKSGHSGSWLAHLHFGVYRTWPTVEGRDLPINFRNARGPLDQRGGLQAGSTYTALPY